MPESIGLRINNDLIAEEFKKVEKSFNKATIDPALVILRNFRNFPETIEAFCSRFFDVRQFTKTQGGHLEPLFADIL